MGGVDVMDKNRPSIFCQAMARLLDGNGLEHLLVLIPIFELTHTEIVQSLSCCQKQELRDAVKDVEKIMLLL